MYIIVLYIITIFQVDGIHHNTIMKNCILLDTPSTWQLLGLFVFINLFRCRHRHHHRHQHNNNNHHHHHHHHNGPNSILTKEVTDCKKWKLRQR